MDITLDIEGMHCASCSMGIEKQLNKLDEVEKATVNLVSEQAFISCKEGTSAELLPALLIDAIKKAGFDAFEAE